MATAFTAIAEELQMMSWGCRQCVTEEGFVTMQQEPPVTGIGHRQCQCSEQDEPLLPRSAAQATLHRRGGEQCEHHQSKPQWPWTILLTHLPTLVVYGLAHRCIPGISCNEGSHCLENSCAALLTILNESSLLWPKRRSADEAAPICCPGED